ncbi:hypothetical protein LWE61_08045 [Sphingobium sufflavum]|uniref:hypothetical protein n=1 Tax=Sphingobium sufflavum TaxID=1129547 RepID=UPI001F288AF1|nr:hypothetical protein [Sphingobium sufflavum]MCE7796512.1 hypothetical protein [Sphingobium sufflavum]
MKSQIYDPADGQPDIDHRLDEADARIAALAAKRAAIAERRRHLIEPAIKTVVANPTDIHHKITLGAVMVNIGMRAYDADALAGLLASTGYHMLALAEELVDPDPSASLGTLLTRLLDAQERELAARGLFETWQRRLAIYAEDREEWLARDEEFRLEGAWRQEPMTAGQRWLVRVTCRVRHLDLPGHLLRGEAADWLEDHGANLNYREFVA